MDPSSFGHVKSVFLIFITSLQIIGLNEVCTEMGRCAMRQKWDGGYVSHPDLPIDNELYIESLGLVNECK